MIQNFQSEIQMTRPPQPPRRPFFGIRLSPLVVIMAIILLVGLGLLICFITDPSFFSRWRPNGFGG